MASEPRIIGKWSDHNGEHSGDIVNPGDCWEPFTVYLFAVADCFDPPVFFVEGSHDCDAYESFTDSDIGERMMRIDDADLRERLIDSASEEDRAAFERGEIGIEQLWEHENGEIHFNGSGVPIDTDNLVMHPAPAGLRYHGDNLPPWGIAPSCYRHWLDGLDMGKRDGADVRFRHHLTLQFDPRCNEPTGQRYASQRGAYRIAYAMGFLSLSPCDRHARAARRYLRGAGLPL